MSVRNYVRFVGNLGKEPEMRYLPSGTAVAKMSIAVNEFRTNKDGEKTKETLWVDLVAYGKLAENLVRLTGQGTKLDVECKYVKRRYEKDGQTRYFHEFEVRDFEILSSRNGGAASEDDGDEDDGSSDASYPF